MDVNSKHESQANLESVLDLIKERYRHLKDKEGCEDALREELEPLKEGFAGSLGDYIGEMDRQMQLFNEDLSNSFLNSDLLNVAFMERKLMIKSLRRGREGVFGLEKMVSRYVTDDSLSFYKMSTSQIQDEVSKHGISRIVESHNHVYYRDRHADAEFAMYSRLKKSVVEKFMRYVLEDYKFLGDLGASRLVFNKPRHLYVVRNLIRDLCPVVNEDPLNMPDDNDEDAIRASLQDAVAVSVSFPYGREEKMDRDEMNRLIKRMKVWISLDVGYNSMPMEVQLFMRSAYDLSESNPVLSHAAYKERNKRDFEGPEKVVEDFFRECSADLSAPLNYAKCRELVLARAL